MAYYNREFREVSRFVDSILYSGYVFESVMTNNDWRLYRNGCMRYLNDNDGKQCETDIIEFIKEYLNSINVDENSEDGRYLLDTTGFDFPKESEEFDEYDAYDNVNPEETRITYILKKYLWKKFPTLINKMDENKGNKSTIINDKIVDKKERAKKAVSDFVNFVKKAIIKKEGEREDKERDNRCKMSSTYDMSFGSDTYNLSPGSSKNNRSNLDDLIAEVDKDYSGDKETK